MIWLASFALAARFGANKICQAVWMYGAPPNVRAVIGMMEEKVHQERWQQYMAMMAWGTFKALRPKADVPMYQTGKAKAEDSRTGREILQQVKEKMRQRLAAREVKKQNETV